MEVIINTPFYVTENSLNGFTRTDTGYALKSNGLPNGELEFVLCTSENPVRRVTPYTYIGWILIGAIGAVIAIVTAIVIVTLVVVIKKIRKRKKKNTR